MVVGVVGGWRKWQVQLVELEGLGVVSLRMVLGMALALALAGLAIEASRAFPSQISSMWVVQGLLGEVHQESLSCTCNKLHM